MAVFSSMDDMMPLRTVELQQRQLLSSSLELVMMITRVKNNWFYEVLLSDYLGETQGRQGQECCTHIINVEFKLL